MAQTREGRQLRITGGGRWCRQQAAVEAAAAGGGAAVRQHGPAPCGARSPAHAPDRALARPSGCTAARSSRKRQEGWGGARALGRGALGRGAIADVIQRCNRQAEHTRLHIVSALLLGRGQLLLQGLHLLLQLSLQPGSRAGVREASCTPFGARPDMLPTNLPVRAPGRQPWCRCALQLMQKLWECGTVTMRLEPRWSSQRVAAWHQMDGSKSWLPSALLERLTAQTTDSH